MKSRVIVIAALAAILVGTMAWPTLRKRPAETGTPSADRKVVYYTCAMHPWVRESKPGPCPVCGMELTAVYGNENGVAETNCASAMVTLEPESIRAINVQTQMAARGPLRHTVHLSCEIVGNSSSAAWFEFALYERDLQWFK